MECGGHNTPRLADPMTPRGLEGGGIMEAFNCWYYTISPVSSEMYLNHLHLHSISIQSSLNNSEAVMPQSAGFEPLERMKRSKSPISNGTIV